jgi:hypothetical protein
MTTGLEKITQLYHEFSAKIVYCRNEPAADMADIQDAYSRLHRLRDRYLHEAYDASSLDPSELSALRKVFENDSFIKGMCKARGIGDHVKINFPILRTTDNAPIEITATTSAASLFARPSVYIKDIHGTEFEYNHLRQLLEAEQRIARAIERAKPPE